MFQLQQRKKVFDYVAGFAEALEPNRRKEENSKTSLIAATIVQILSRAHSAPVFFPLYLVKTKKRERMFLIDFPMVVSS